MNNLQKAQDKNREEFEKLFAGLYTDMMLVRDMRQAYSGFLTTAENRIIEAVRNETVKICNCYESDDAAYIKKDIKDILENKK